MATTSISPGPPDLVGATPDITDALRRLTRATARYAEARRDAWLDQLKGVAQPAGATDRAVVEGLTAWATGHNPVTAALRGAWAGADAKTKVAIVAVLVLVAVVAPVLLLLLLLALLVTALVLKARSAGGPR